MRTKFKLVDPSKMEATITVTATLERWKELRKDMKDCGYYGVAQELRLSIDRAVSQAEKVFWSDDESDI